MHRIQNMDFSDIDLVAQATFLDSYLLLDN